MMIDYTELLDGFDLTDESIQLEEQGTIEDDVPKYIVLVIYDIISNKQRAKLVKLLDKYASRVQKSCFESKLTKKQYVHMVAEIKAMLKSDDNVRIYKIRGEEQIETFGSKQYEDLDDTIII